MKTGEEIMPTLTTGTQIGNNAEGHVRITYMGNS